jgi:proton-translocating NAD(P)+ transhydrogenase subunit alpha
VPVKVGVVKETAPGERRVPLVPDAASRLVPAGVELLVEAGAGESASFLDSAYAEAGFKVVADAAVVHRHADVVVRIQKPSTGEVSLLRDGQVLIAMLQPLVNTELVRQIASRGAVAFSMDSIPRITRAQAMDVLSSQATIAGYKAVLAAAGALGKFIPMLTTAAGTMPPARVLILGAGVAGLQAIATARRLGGVVSAFDTRPVVKEQVESLGATFLELEVTGEETEGGYAAELTEEQHRHEQEAIAGYVAEADVVITTAAIPGKRAPVLITDEAVFGMRPGAVIVDLAAETGGNCELTVPGETVTRHNVTIVGLRNWPSEMPQHASQMYSRNVQALLLHLVQDGALVLDFEDEITRETCVARDGRQTGAPAEAVPVSHPEGP